MTSALDGLRHFALVLQRGSSNAAGQNAALLIHKLQQEILVFIINVLDAVLLEAAVLLLLQHLRCLVEDEI